MDKQEFGIFASALRTYFPREQILPNKEAMELWYQELQDIPQETAITCLRKWVSLNKWSPSIAEIREMCAVIVNGEPRTWQDGWDAVLTEQKQLALPLQEAIKGIQLKGMDGEILKIGGA